MREGEREKERGTERGRNKIWISGNNVSRARCAIMGFNKRSYAQAFHAILYGYNKMDESAIRSR